MAGLMRRAGLCGALIEVSFLLCAFAFDMALGVHALNEVPVLAPMLRTHYAILAKCEDLMSAAFVASQFGETAAFVAAIGLTLGLAVIVWTALCHVLFYILAKAKRSAPDTK